MAICLSTVLFTGCFFEKDKKKQEDWVKKMGETFKDDKFEYEGAHRDMFGADKHMANIKSKKYPDAGIYVTDKSGEVLTNYNHIRYKDEVEEYVYDYFDGMFHCDSYETKYTLPILSPIKNYSAKKFIKECVNLNVDVFLYITDGEYPTEEEMEEKLLDIAAESNGKCKVSVFCSEGKVKNEFLESECYFVMTMSEAHKVDSIYVAYDSGKTRKVLVQNAKV